MKPVFCSWAWQRWLPAAVLFLGITISLAAQEKRIFLRNETITTLPTAAAARLSLQNDDPVSGLYLIQFDGPYQGGWVETLRAAGAQLLTYVPQDAFIVRLTDARLGAIRALPFVRWLGEYRPDHKLHNAVSKWWQQAQNAEAHRISVVVSPLATDLERLAVQRLLQKVEHHGQTRFGQVLRGSVLKPQLVSLLRSPAVLWVERAPSPRLFDEVAAGIVAGIQRTNQLRTQALGFDGTGVKVAVADSGLDTGVIEKMHPDIAGRVSALFFYGDLEDASDGHSHGTHVTGIVGGNASTGEKDDNGFLYGLGVAPGVSIIAQRIFDDAGGYQAPPSYEKLTRDAVQAGADIGSNSWGDDTQGRYDVSASEFDGLVRDADAVTPGDQQYILEFSAGNAGPGERSIGSPAVGKNVIATGASENDRLDLFIYADGTNSMADFSSRGPCEDGRIKPDISAPGTWIASMKSRLASEDNAWAGISDNYIYQGGTSQAGPQVSGAAAVFVQYFKELYGKKPSPALVKAALINSAIDMDDEGGTGPIPNNDEGWGRVDLTRLIQPESRQSDFVDQSNLLTTGQVFEKRVVVLTSEEPFKVTLAYTDVPAFAGATKTLVNDLNLEVVGPDGTLYRGNQFSDGESLPNPLPSDGVNNVEGVHLNEPLPGEYILRVRARNVVMDARADTAPVDQDFALVASGVLPLPGLGAVLLDRLTYTAPSQIRVTVLDPQKSGQPSVTATVRSGSEPAGELIVLKASAFSGLFTGAVVTATGPAVADGRLQIKHADLIEALYQLGTDTLRKAATADLVAPVISSVSSTNEFGSVTVSWRTDEPATSLVYFGLNSLDRSATDSGFLTDHAVTLDRLDRNKLYRYAVVSTDEAGNTRTNNNAGAFWTFTSPTNKTVLLVDAYSPDEILDSIFIPLTSYTSALDKAGFSYDVWTRASLPELKPENLRSYRAVIWRINDMDFGASITAKELTALTNFVAGGGGFFMASMEGLSRFGNVTFNSELAHVSSFVEDLEAGFVDGVAGDPISSSMSFLVDYSNYPNLSEFGFGGPDFSDHLVPSTNAAPFFSEDVSSAVVGVRYPKSFQGAGGRTVFMSFPLDGVPSAAAAPNNRATLLRNVLAFLAPGADGIGTLALNNSRYTLPSQVEVEVGDSDLEGTGSLTLKVSSDTVPAGITISLTEGGTPGVFHGSFTLVAVGEPSGPGRLYAAQGDSVKAEYLDASTQSSVLATAIIDIQAPTISTPPSVEPDFEQAIISWATSEAGDSLVQFGETTRLGKTAFSSTFETLHEVTLDGLGPDRTYFYKIVTRDQAGNAVEDDNQGKLYTFRTLRPRDVPWVDDLETGGDGWTVIDSEETQGTWKLGVPHNGHETAAHSPTHAWGSNIDGAQRDAVESFLLGPALNLSGGNKATLRFWHSYDFTQKTELDILDGGEVMIITNNAASPITLASFENDLSSWTEEEIDLTPYMGHVVYIVFHYALFSLDLAPRGGWLIDDVSVTVENIIPASLEVTNTVTQARFSVTGPSQRSGQGSFFAATNLPPGEYVVTFSAVPNYVTPPPQTNSIAAGQTWRVLGDYLFPDVNHNGISDLWEKQYFGQVAGSHPPETDTDHDGRSDLAEFLAGTDPTSSDSILKLGVPVVQPGGAVVLTWPTVADRAYRILGTQDLLHWEAVSEWIVGKNGQTSRVLPPSPTSAPRFFRVEVLP